jgi:hypothetical protein
MSNKGNQKQKASLQIDRQTDRHTDTRTHRQTDKQTHRQIENHEQYAIKQGGRKIHKNQMQSGIGGQAETMRDGKADSYTDRGTCNTSALQFPFLSLL